MRPLCFKNKVARLPDEGEIAAKVCESKCGQPALVLSKQFARPAQAQIGLGYLETVVGVHQHFKSLG